ncbi:hypothetical protein [Nonomuraea sp. NPDC049784]|uniref:hypothetical protein n=1 Tax=Nonomuraea sp. NPDC049784 TaxID=3154361 RepID=UPI0033E8DBEB
MSWLPARKEPLWRGVSLDLRAQCPLGRTVTWWGILAPGTQFEVTGVKTERGGLCTVQLTELPEQPLVA